MFSCSPGFGCCSPTAPLAIWIIVAAWLLPGATSLFTLNNLVMGLLLILVSLRRGSIREQYGSWQRLIR